MRLISLELTNFKGISEKQKIEFRPVTLLYGANNAGKSTILHALHYLREILVRENLNASFTIGGGQWDLGGFEAFVHKHDLNETITIKVTFEISSDLRTKYLPGNREFSKSEMNDNILDIMYALDDSEDYNELNMVKTVGFEIDIGWNSTKGCPHVKRISSELNDEGIAEITADESDTNAKIEKINVSHPLLLKANRTNTEILDESIPIFSPFTLHLLSFYPEIKEKYIELPNLLKVEINSKMALPSQKNEFKLVGLKTENEKDKIEESLTKLFKEIILGPANIAKHCLQQFKFIGPIREIPTRNSKPFGIADDANWANGLAAWQKLYNETNDKLIDEVNYWMKDKFDSHCIVERSQNKVIQIFDEKKHSQETDISIESQETENMEKSQENDAIKNTYEIDVSNKIDKYMNSSKTEEEIKEIRKIYLSLKSHGELNLIDTTNNIYVKPHDVGVGISQLLPVVVASLDNNIEMLIIEQPELHLNPKMQSPLGDLFIESIQVTPQRPAKMFLIETHSEHLLLRLFRRIRETSKNKEDEIDSNKLSLLPEDLSVYYVLNSQSKISYVHVEIDKVGDFLGIWPDPDGFFDERMKDLF